MARPKRAVPVEPVDTAPILAHLRTKVGRPVDLWVDLGARPRAYKVAGTLADVSADSVLIRAKNGKETRIPVVWLAGNLQADLMPEK